MQGQGRRMRPCENPIGVNEGDLMRKGRLVMLVALLCSLVLSLPTYAKCPRTQDGYVVCNAHCTYPNNCVAGGSGYCYYDLVVNVCFDGAGEPCCGTASVF